jgi:glyoxylase-like metal-dependent hydrolase (beta-lactamase superfamily II)
MIAVATDNPIRVDLGGCIATILSGGAFRLDGGAMFGIIPKPLWCRSVPAEADNSIRLACNCVLLAWSNGRRAIVEVGHGPKFAAKEQGFFAIDPARWVLPALRANGVDPESIGDVVLTHLHFDHAGGLTHYDDSGRPVATFPSAKVHVQRREFEDARANFGIMTNTYREENFTPIDALDAWRLLDGEVEILPGVRALLTPGHTRGHHSIVIEGATRTLVYGGDVMPTRHHIGRPYNMGYDLFPLDNRESKAKLLARAAEHDWLVAIDHEPDEPLVTATREKGWFSLKPAAT